MRQAIVCHDAGAAEILSSYARQCGTGFYYVVAGPAIKVFQRKLGNIKIQTLQSIISKLDSVLCGTGWQTDYEYKAIELARLHGVHSIAFLDHWMHYLERFKRGGKTCFPDEIWVGDPIAEEMIKKLLPRLKVRLYENPYFLEVVEELAVISTLQGDIGANNTVLYVCEPIREFALALHNNERFWGYTEEEAVTYFLSNIEFVTDKIENIILRPHPSEPVHKYNYVKDRFDLPINIGGKRTLLEEINACGIVVGCESMAMVIGLLANKRVVSCIPPGGHACQLPHSEIEHLKPRLVV